VADTQRSPMKLLARAVCVATLAWSGHASALGLIQAYQAALQNDPTYRGAFFESEAGKEARIQGRAALLPQLGANFNLSQNRADTLTTSNNILGQPTTSLTHPKYTSRVESVSLRQAVLNLEAISRYKQTVAQSSFAAARFEGQAQEMILRVTGAYFDVLYGDEQVALATAERDMYIEQRQVNDRLFKQGEGTRTDMLETQARLDVAEARLIETIDGRNAAREALSKLIGDGNSSLDPMAPDFRIMPAPDRLDELRKQALANNPDIQALQYSVEATRQEINRARSGHAPRVDFVASYSKNDSETINTYNQDSTVRSIGVQVSIPLYQGGQVNSVSRQAVANYEKAKTDLQARIDKLTVDLGKDYAATQSGAAKIRALTKAVESSKLLVQATEQSIKGGVRINLDLLNARQQLFTSQRDLAQARYSYLLASMRLRSAVGSLSVDDVKEVAAYFR
jgi:outer membrane protein, protease secretion system